MDKIRIMDKNNSMDKSRIMDKNNFMGEDGSILSNSYLFQLRQRWGGSNSIPAAGCTCCISSDSTGGVAIRTIRV